MCCDKSQEGASQQAHKKPSGKKLDNAVVPEELLRLKNERSDSVGDATLKGNLFGRFFCERAEFFVIDNPQNEIYSQIPGSIVLYYLDGELWQSKYEFREDISNRLYKELGRCRIVGLDEKNKKIIGSKEIRVSTEMGIRFNPELDNYEIKWRIGDREVKYRVEKVKDKNRFFYIEKLKDYEKQYNQIEKYC